MSNLDKVRAKISALLKKNTENGASEAEALASFERAQRLMQEHGVSMKDIQEQTEAALDFSKIIVGDGSTLSILDKFLATTIAKYTDTKVWSETVVVGRGQRGRKRTKTQIHFYGYSVDVELAQYIYNMCSEAMEAEWWKFAHANVPTGHRRKMRNSFMIGMSCRLRDRLKELMNDRIQTTGNDLIVLKNTLVEQNWKKATGNVKLQNKSGGTHKYYTNPFNAGQKAAENVRFNREVKNGPDGGVKLIA